MRRRIGHALKNRSRAIKTAVKRYNVAAANLTPPRESLDAKNILEYVTMAEFDLLRIMEHDILEKPWVCPEAREATTAYFKVTRAHEELRRVHQEADRLMTYMDDVEVEMERVVQLLKSNNEEGLAFQVRRRQEYDSLVHDIHHARLACLRSLGIEVRRGTAVSSLDSQSGTNGLSTGTLHSQSAIGGRNCARLQAFNDIEEGRDSEDDDVAEGEQRDVIDSILDD